MSNLDNHYPIDPFSRIIKTMQDMWYEFVVNNNRQYMKITEITYDMMCNMVCNSMKPMMLDIARSYARELEEEQRRSQKSKNYVRIPVT